MTNGSSDHRYYSPRAKRKSVRVDGGFGAEQGESLLSGGLEQWCSTWGTRAPGGTRRHLRGYVKFKKKHILFYDKH